MRIESLSPMMTRSLIAALPKALSAFPVPDEVPAHPQAPAAAAPGPATSVQMLITLGTVGASAERRRAMAEKTQRGLNALDRLHAELVAGTAAPARLREIADWSANLDLSEDATLAAIQSEIDLRVRVELAKFDIEA